MNTTDSDKLDIFHIFATHIYTVLQPHLQISVVYLCMHRSQVMQGTVQTSNSLDEPGRPDCGKDPWIPLRNPRYIQLLSLQTTRPHIRTCLVKFLKSIELLIGTPSQRYGLSLAMWDHTVLPATLHK